MRRRGRAAIVLWIAFLAGIGLLASRARFTTDLSAFLPSSPTPAQRVLVDQLREGVVSQLLLVGLEGAPPERLAQMSAVLAEQLAGAPEFLYVNNGGEERMQADAIAFATNATFQNIGNPERLPNLSQIVHRVPAITHYAGATDHAQLFDPGQTGQDIVLDAIGKISVLLIVAEIFEWKNRNPFCVHRLRFHRTPQQSIAQEKKAEANGNERIERTENEHGPPLRLASPR